MRNSSRLLTSVAFGLMALLAASGCTAPATGPSATAPTKTLRIATDDEPGRPAAAQVEEYARQVKDVSGGKILIEPVWKAVGHDKDDWDQAVARGVVAGEFDLGLVPARAWDTEGVSSFAALHAPFLVTSNSLLAKVTDPAIADEMLTGLDKLGVTGLALLPEGTRLLFSFGKPALKPADLAGKTVRAPRSDTTYALLKALGATPDDLVGELFPDGVAAGTVGAAESSFAFANALPEPTTATGNLVLYPKVNSLVVNSSALRALSDAEQQFLRAAASATRTWAAETMTAQADDAAQFCKDGGTVVTATDVQVALFKAAGAPVYTKIESDPQAKARIARIRELAAAEPAPAAVKPCSPGG
jgi:TRAP-type C4-dicarboxylate transport system substrate-binding protein